MGAVMKNGVNYSGGSSGTNDYVDLMNKPAINGVTLAGNKSSDDLGIITKVVNDLVNYYNKTDSYSKAEVDTMIAAAKNGRFVAVATLPTSNIQTNVIYLVPSSDPETGNVKDEYINLDGTTAGWEKIGNTDIDLALTALSDVNITSPTDNQVLKYNSTSGKWENGTGGGGGGGHTIKDEDGTAMTQRTNLQFGEAFDVSDDSTNNATVVEVNELESGDMDDIVFPLPSSPAVPAAAGFTPVGTVISVMGVNAPTHYLKCDGTAYNIVDYPELSTYFEQQFGSKNFFGGDGTTTFAVPDLRGEFLRGTGTNSHTNQGSGANVGVHQDGSVHVTMISDGGYYQTRATNKAEITNLADSVYSAGTQKYMSLQTDASGTKYELYTSRPTNTSVLYCIATKNIYLNPAMDYSTDEKVVGKWIDGKPLYQKTISFGALPNASEKTVAHGISNLDFVVNISAVYKDGTNRKSLPIVRQDNVANQTQYSITDTIIWVKTGLNESSANAYFTLQYTKSTDSANS